MYVRTVEFYISPDHSVDEYKKHQSDDFHYNGDFRPEVQGETPMYDDDAPLYTAEYEWERFHQVDEQMDQTNPNNIEYISANNGINKRKYSAFETDHFSNGFEKIASTSYKYSISNSKEYEPLPQCPDTDPLKKKFKASDDHDANMLSRGFDTIYGTNTPMDRSRGDG